MAAFNEVYSVVVSLRFNAPLIGFVSFRFNGRFSFSYCMHNETK